MSQHLSEARFSAAPKRRFLQLKQHFQHFPRSNLLSLYHSRTLPGHLGFLFFLLENRTTFIHAFHFSEHRHFRKTKRTLWLRVARSQGRHALRAAARSGNSAGRKAALGPAARASAAAFAAAGRRAARAAAGAPLCLF